MKKRFGEQKRTYQFAFRKPSQFKHFFSLEVDQMIFLCQQKYIEDLFKSFECWNASQSQLEWKLLQNCEHIKAKNYKME